jgi:HSP20 family protein
MNLVRFSTPRFSTNRFLSDELFSNFFKNDYHENYGSYGGRKPAANVFETENDFKIEVLLPGFAKEDVQINYQNNLLTIKVENEKNEESEMKYKYEHREFETFNFEKQFRIPKSIDDKKINAKFENGILNIQLPKKEEKVEKAPKEIKIA